MNVAQVTVQMYNYQGNLVQVPMFQLLQWKHAMRLEAQGLTHSKGSVTAHVRKFLGTPARYPRDELIAHLEATQKDVEAQIGVTV